MGGGCRLEVCRALVAAAEAFGISDCWTWKPVLDGKQVGGARTSDGVGGGHLLQSPHDAPSPSHMLT